MNDSYNLSQLKLPEKYKLNFRHERVKRFWMVFKFFFILFNPFIIGKIEKIDFWDAYNSKKL